MEQEHEWKCVIITGRTFPYIKNREVAHPSLLCLYFNSFAVVTFKFHWLVHKLNLFGDNRLQFVSFLLQTVYTQQLLSKLGTKVWPQSMNKTEVILYMPDEDLFKSFKLPTIVSASKFGSFCFSILCVVINYGKDILVSKQ